MAAFPEQDPLRQSARAGGHSRRLASLFPYTALAPTGGAITLSVRADRLRFIANRGEGALLEARETLAQVLRSPEAIFVGIRSDRDEANGGDGWMCYCGSPKFRYLGSGRMQPSDPDRCFLAFVTEGLIVYNWRWEEVEPGSRLPKSYESRFREKVYP